MGTDPIGVSCTQEGKDISNVTDKEQDWRVITENGEAAIEPLEQGHCDGILAAARGFLDGFAESLLRAGHRVPWVRTAARRGDDAATRPRL